MCRRSSGGGRIARWLRLGAVLGAVLGALAIIAAPACGDDIADYLEQHGLKRLLAVHLEQQLEQAPPEARGDLVLRLAGLYAELFETVADPMERQALEERSRRLLEKAPSNSADELRLALLRATYRSAEKIAENHRLRLSNAEEVESARKMFAEITPQLTALRLRFRQNAEVADRRLSRSAGSEAMAVGGAGERVHNLYAQCTFFAAWALYYQAWLNNHDDNARVAEPLFAELFAPDAANPQPTDVSVDLRSVEAVARALLGMALCKSRTSSSATAVSWLGLLEHENTFEPLRVQVPGWKIAVYLEHREYEHLRDFLAQQKARGGEMQLAWLRLIAVNTLEESQRTRQADELARSAILELASRGELDQVLDLATRYGPESLGNSGFALQYVHGLIKYQEARKAHGNETPTVDQVLIGLYQAAVDDLKTAAAEPDAGNYADAAAACSRLIAWCRYFQSRFLDARQAFEQAADNLRGNDAAEALWMALVALDKVVEAGGDDDLQAQLNRLTDRFVAQFPSSPHTPTLRLRRAVAAKQASPEAVEELLAIPPSSDVYRTAQRRASDLLYQLFREARAEDKTYYGNRFLSVAAALLGPAERAADLARPGEIQRCITRCRQVLEVAVNESIRQTAAARIALDALAQIQIDGGLDLSQFTDEIDCRRVQERLLESDAPAAADVAEKLWNRDQTSIWTRLATRAMFKYGHQLWKNAEASPSDKSRGMQIVVRFGGRVLYEFKDAPDDLGQSGALGYHSAVAEASMTLWEQTGDPETGRGALFLYEKLLAARPRNAAFLRAAAVLSERFGDPDRALDCWRRLVAGSENGSEPWYESKFHLLALLAKTDPVRAREVMDQHKQLNPDYGPEPWGPRLKGLDVQIPPAAAPPTPETPASQPIDKSPESQSKDQAASASGSRATQRDRPALSSFAFGLLDFWTFGLFAPP